MHRRSAVTQSSTTTTVCSASADALPGFYRKDANSSFNCNSALPYQRSLRIDTVRECLIRMEYAVRGAIVGKAEQMKKTLEQKGSVTSERQMVVSQIIPANIGNPQAVGQKPLTFYRQILSCLINPLLLGITDGSNCSNKTSSCLNATPQETLTSRTDKLTEQEERLSQSSTVPSIQLPITRTIAEDVRERVSRYLAGLSSMGAYSHSQGASVFREDVAKWFERRDGFPCDVSTIFLTDGASSGIRLALELLLSSKNDGIMIPVPQYPLYSASITRLDGVPVPYYLEEEHQWRLTTDVLEKAFTEAKQKGVNVRALVILNPGNPTGSVLGKQEVLDIVRWCAEHSLVILADEVYQENVYSPTKTFVSFRKSVKELQANTEVISFHSSSKGLAGECGFRGGVMQVENVDPEIIALLYKMSSVGLCSNTVGQAVMASIVNPPCPGEPSYALYSSERAAIYDSLCQKAQLATATLNSMEGVTCQPIEGAMYAFPSIVLPQKAIVAAHKQNVEPDFLYCMEMLEDTGVVCVPGSGFGQLPGTYHFRVTILPPLDVFNKMLSKMQQFHKAFLVRYSDSK